MPFLVTRSLSVLSFLLPRSFLGGAREAAKTEHSRAEQSRAEQNREAPIIYDTCEAEIACCRKIWQRLHFRKRRQNSKIREKFVLPLLRAAGGTSGKRFKWRFGVEIALALALD